MEVVEGSVIHGRYEILERLGNGAFGEVFRAYDVNSGQQFAIKVEPHNSPDPCLGSEKLIYDRLWSWTFPIGILRPTSFLAFGDNDILVLPLLGCSLRKLWQSNGNFSLQSISTIGMQMLNRLEHIHRLGILHLDIKPENLMVGRGLEAKKVYLIDFGLSRRYTDQYGIQVRYRELVGFTGTRVFSSVNVDSLRQPSPRDDLESLMYTLMMLHKGRLPWCSGDWKCSANYPTAFEEIKQDYREQLCSKMPREFQIIWKIISNMDYGDTPSYTRLKELFATSSWCPNEDDGLCFGLE